MVFKSPKWVPPLPMDPPDSIPISEFMLDDRWGRFPLAGSLTPFTCGLSGAEYTAVEVRDRVNALAKGLSEELGWKPNEGTEWDKVIGVFSVNTVRSSMNTCSLNANRLTKIIWSQIDVPTLAWAVHTLSGISSPANAAYSEPELVHQLKSSGAKALFTCLPLLSISLAAAAKSGIPRSRVYLLSIPQEAAGNVAVPENLKTVDELIAKGAGLPALEPLRWSKGQGARQTAFLCYSSGTSGLPKGVMISHRNVIANVLQITTYERPYRQSLKKEGGESDPREVVLGLLPQSHIYSLVVICHASMYRGDQVINLPKFDFEQYLSSIQRFKINQLYLVPPIIIAMANNKAVAEKFDLSSVRAIFTGAAPLGKETAEAMQLQRPGWTIRQGYGLTETCTVVSSSAEDDVWFGSSGSFLPAIEAKILSPDGNEITEHDQPGELLVKSPSVVLGYLNNEKATKETFENGWMRTGDEAVVRVGPNGNEHVFIVDRIKELIKVKGMQVAPAELEAHILSHPSVADCAVIPVPDDAAGERPKAFIVKSPFVGVEEGDHKIKQEISKYIRDHKARHKWLDGGIEFIDVIPKSTSGKILRRMLRDKEKETRRKRGARL